MVEELGVDWLVFYGLKWFFLRWFFYFVLYVKRRVVVDSGVLEERVVVGILGDVFYVIRVFYFVSFSLYENVFDFFILYIKVNYINLIYLV